MSLPVEEILLPEMQGSESHRSMWADWLIPGGRRRKVAGGFVLLLVFGVCALVVATGGIKFVYAHAMYVPVLLAALFFRWQGALVVAALGGFLLGPFMPIDTATGEMQQTANWVIRTGLLLLTGGTAGVGVEVLMRRIKWEKWAAEHDPHTGLRNLVGLERLAHEQWFRQPEEALCCIVVEAVNLSSLVSSLGPEWGNRVAMRLGETLRKQTPGVLCIARYTTKKVAVLAQGIQADALHELMVELFVRQHHSCTWGDMAVNVEVKAGALVEVCTNLQTVIELTRKADNALEAAMDSGRTFGIYSPEGDERSREAVALLGQLKPGIRDGQLRLYFQPKVGIASRKTESFEALVRWEHPERGLVPPGLFIPQAEQTSLIDDLTDWIVGESLARLSEWSKMGYDLTLSLNVSARNLQHPAFKQRLEQHLRSATVDPSRLELEITESAIMHEADRVVELLNEIRELKVLLSIDDFGTGYSSLAYLGRLPVSAIKVDQHFIRSLDQAGQPTAIVRAAVGLAEDFGLKTVAEGVESEGILATVAGLGVHQAQGYLFSKPMPADEVPSWLAASAWPGIRNRPV